VEPGRTYNVRGWVNIPEVTNPCRFSLQVQTMTRWNGIVSGPNPLMGSLYSGPTAGWELIEGSITIPSNAEKARVLMKVESLNGTIYMDDLEFFRADAVAPDPTGTATPQAPTPTPTVTFTAVPATVTLTTAPATATPTTAPSTVTSTPAPATATPTAVPATATPTATSTPPVISGELVVNGGFEQDADGKGAPDGWSVPSWLASLVSRDGSDAYQGSHSLRIASSAGQTFSVSQDVPAQGGATYLVAAWVKVPSSTGSFSISIQGVPLNTWGGNLPMQVVGNPISTVSNVWVPISGTVVLPTNATKLRVQIATSSLRATVLVDGVSVTKQ